MFSILAAGMKASGVMVRGNPRGLFAKGFDGKTACPGK